jgi:hypothetical protein
VVAGLTELVLDAGVTLVADLRLLGVEKRNEVRAMRLVAPRAVIVDERSVLDRHAAQPCDGGVAAEAQLALTGHENAAEVRCVRVVAVDAVTLLGGFVRLGSVDLFADRVAREAEVIRGLGEQNTVI